MLGLAALFGCVVRFALGLTGGGGFVIVPALVLFSGIEIHRVVGTSLFVIFLISIGGVASHVAHGNELPVETTRRFLAGGFVGMCLGGILANRLKGPTLQMVFAGAVVMVAAFVIVKSVVL